MRYNHAMLLSSKQLLLGNPRPGRWVWTLDWCLHLCSCFLMAPCFRAVAPAPLALPKPHLPWVLQLAGPAPENATTYLLLIAHLLTSATIDGYVDLTLLQQWANLAVKCLQSDCSAMIVYKGCVGAQGMQEKHLRGALHCSTGILLRFCRCSRDRKSWLLLTGQPA